MSVPQLIFAKIVYGIIVLLVLGSTACSSSREEAETAEAKVDQLSRKLQALESSLQTGIEEVKNQSLIFFLLGLGIGSLGFLFVQHQLKRLRLTQEDRTQVVLAEPAQRDRPSDS